MNLRRCVGALLLAGCFLGLASAADAQVLRWRRGYGYAAPAYPPTAYTSYPPYVMPLPAYGILPPPLATYYMLQGAGTGATGYNYGASTDQLDYIPRQRPSAYPAIPFEKSEVRLSDLRRVRYEITVPFAHATVLIDGAKTKQTGLQRSFITPPLQEDKQYSTTVVVQWLDENKMPRTRQRTFTVVAGETIRHAFVE